MQIIKIIRESFVHKILATFWTLRHAQAKDMMAHTYNPLHHLYGPFLNPINFLWRLSQNTISHVSIWRSIYHSIKLEQLKSPRILRESEGSPEVTFSGWCSVTGAAHSVTLSRLVRLPCAQVKREPGDSSCKSSYFFIYFEAGCMPQSCYVHRSATPKYVETKNYFWIL